MTQIKLMETIRTRLSRGADPSKVIMVNNMSNVSSLPMAIISVSNITNLIENYSTLQNKKYSNTKIIKLLEDALKQDGVKPLIMITEDF